MSIACELFPAVLPNAPLAHWPQAVGVARQRWLAQSRAEHLEKQRVEERHQEQVVAAFDRVHASRARLRVGIRETRGRGTP